MELSILETILGEGMTAKLFIAFYIMGIFGLLASIAFDVYSSGTTVKDFSIKYWFESNVWRLVLSILVVAIGVLFSEQLLGATLTTWTAFLVGFTSDKLIENLMQRKRRKTQNFSEQHGSTQHHN